MNWPHQDFAFKAVIEAAQNGHRRILVTSPTGAGKTLMMQQQAERCLEQRKRAVLYTNRKMLVDQTSEAMLKAGIYHGVRAAGYEDEREHSFQISSVQTEHSRVTKKKTWTMHDADLALVDEAHNQTGKSATTLLNAHHDAGACYIGYTATPIGLGEIYDTLIVAGTPSELRECNALVPAHHWGPDEPDMKSFKGLVEGADLSENQQKKAMMTPGIFGRVWNSFEQVNPEHRPTFLFGPGVAESVWFAQQFTAKGVRAAHIDGQDIWVDGEVFKSDRDVRQQILADSKSGRIGVICNRFVLREGIDAPWISHCVLATVFGSLQSYLQAGGRILRACEGKDIATIQDHGGNWWRHGSLNEDRHWELCYTDSIVYGLRADRLRNKTEAEPRRCPQCSRIVKRKKCICGFEFTNEKRSRPVVSTDGTLKFLNGDIFRPRSICTRPDGPELWKQMYFRSSNGKGKRTFSAAMALFAYENNWQYPNPDWPLMPVAPLDKFRQVADVPRGRLT